MVRNIQRMENMVDLSNLTDEEREIITNVLLKDDELRKLQETKISEVKAEINAMRLHSVVQEGEHTDKVCGRCHSTFGYIFNTGELCPHCHFRVCKGCRVKLLTGGWVCALCFKQNQLKCLNGEWLMPPPSGINKKNGVNKSAPDIVRASLVANQNTDKSRSTNELNDAQTAQTADATQEVSKRKFVRKISTKKYDDSSSDSEAGGESGWNGSKSEQNVIGMHIEQRGNDISSKNGLEHASIDERENGSNDQSLRDNFMQGSTKATLTNGDLHQFSDKAPTQEATQAADQKDLSHRHLMETGAGSLGEERSRQFNNIYAQVGQNSSDSHPQHDLSSVIFAREDEQHLPQSAQSETGSITADDYATGDTNHAFAKSHDYLVVYKDVEIKSIQNVATEDRASIGLSGVVEVTDDEGKAADSSNSSFVDIEVSDDVKSSEKAQDGIKGDDGLIERDIRSIDHELRLNDKSNTKGNLTLDVASCKDNLSLEIDGSIVSFDLTPTEASAKRLRIPSNHSKRGRRRRKKPRVDGNHSEPSDSDISSIADEISEYKAGEISDTKPDEIFKPTEQEIESKFAEMSELKVMGISGSEVGDISECKLEEISEPEKEISQFNSDISGSTAEQVDESQDNKTNKSQDGKVKQIEDPMKNDPFVIDISPSDVAAPSSILNVKAIETVEENKTQQNVIDWINHSDPDYLHAADSTDDPEMKVINEEDFVCDLQKDRLEPVVEEEPTGNNGDGESGDEDAIDQNHGSDAAGECEEEDAVSTSECCNLIYEQERSHNDNYEEDNGNEITAEKIVVDSVGQVSTANSGDGLIRRVTFRESDLVEEIGTSDVTYDSQSQSHDGELHSMSKIERKDVDDSNISVMQNSNNQDAIIPKIVISESTQGFSDETSSEEKLEVSMREDEGNSYGDPAMTSIAANASRGSPRSPISTPVQQRPQTRPIHMLDDDEDDDDISDLHTDHTRFSSLRGRHTNLLSQLAGSVESLTTSLYSQAPGSGYGVVTVSGAIFFGIDYTETSLHILVKQCTDLAAVDHKRSRSDPYVKAYLLPDQTKTGKRKTKIRKRTINPVFNETLTFNIDQSELIERTLWLSVWHSDRLGRNIFLGDIKHPLASHDFTDKVPMWFALQDSNAEQTPQLVYAGEIELSIMYIDTGKSEAKKKKSKVAQEGLLQVHVQAARNLVSVRSNGTADAFCKGYLLPDKNIKQKSGVLKKTCDPDWDVTFTFPCNPIDLVKRCLELTVWDHDRITSNDFLGGVRLNLGTGAAGEDVVDWMDARNEEVTLWSLMLDQPGVWHMATLPLRSHMQHRK